LEFSLTNFAQLGLSKPLLNALAAKDYGQPTPIQAQAIPIVLQGRDLLGIAQTGTGKTAAFMLPSLDRLVAASKGRPVPGRARMLVLAPTRELAAQIATSARTYAAGQHISVGVIFGGTPVPRSIREVSRGLDVLVATPGRLLDLIFRLSFSRGVLNQTPTGPHLFDVRPFALHIGFCFEEFQPTRAVEAPARRACREELRGADADPGAGHPDRFVRPRSPGQRGHR
jgi:hypothetical protein